MLVGRFHGIGKNIYHFCVAYGHNRVGFVNGQKITIQQGRIFKSMEDKNQIVETTARLATSGEHLVSVLPVEPKPVSPVAMTTTGFVVPAIIDRSGMSARKRFIEFFTANIRNHNTRKAYALAISDFLAWCNHSGLQDITAIDPVLIAYYIEKLQTKVSVPTVKQNLAAIRVFLDWMVLGGILPFNPSASVRGPKHVVRRGVTPVLTAAETRCLLDSIETDGFKGLRDRALIGAMVFTFARVNAVLAMRVEDYYTEGRRSWFRLHEKGGKLHCVPAHHLAEQYMDEYLAFAGIGREKKSPLFRSIGANKLMSDRSISCYNVLRMIKRRAAKVGLPDSTCCHTFRATGITAYLENGGTLEKAQAIAAHESTESTKLYDRTNDTITLDEIERIRI